jgi:2-polyprenyl-6-methoxyphenol hydroxylase-like FAD-dependent oxidoreductase
MERCLRDVLNKNGFSDLRVGCNVYAIEEDDQWVYASYRDHHGIEKRARAKFLAGCDGKIGYTRKKYLEKKGVLLERTAEYVATNIPSDQLPY